MLLVDLQSISAGLSRERGGADNSGQVAPGQQRGWGCSCCPKPPQGAQSFDASSRAQRSRSRRAGPAQVPPTPAAPLLALLIHHFQVCLGSSSPTEGQGAALCPLTQPRLQNSLHGEHGAELLKDTLLGAGLAQRRGELIRRGHDSSRAHPAPYVSDTQCQSILLLLAAGRLPCAQPWGCSSCPRCSRGALQPAPGCARGGCRGAASCATVPPSCRRDRGRAKQASSTEGNVIRQRINLLVSRLALLQLAASILFSPGSSPLPVGWALSTSVCTAGGHRACTCMGRVGLADSPV